MDQEKVIAPGENDLPGLLIEDHGSESMSIANDEDHSSPVNLLQVLCQLRDLLNTPAVTAALGSVSAPQEGLTSKPLLTEPLAADLLGISGRELAELRRSGALPHSTYMQREKRCHVLYVREALLKYFNTRRN